MQWNARTVTTTYNSCLTVYDRMYAWFHEHTYNSVSICDYCRSSYFLNGTEMNVNALNISSGHVK